MNLRQAEVNLTLYSKDAKKQSFTPGVVKDRKRLLSPNDKPAFWKHSLVNLFVSQRATTVSYRNHDESPSGGDPVKYRKGSDVWIVRHNPCFTFSGKKVQMTRTEAFSWLIGNIIESARVGLRSRRFPL